MISVDLARRLQAAGLRWVPADGDRFFMPDRDLDDRIFTISEMTVDVREVAGGRMIAFNGTVEWALDAIMEHEVIWLPREAQLRELLGEAFVRLERVGEHVRCDVELAGRPRGFEHADAAEAYGLALLERLTSGAGGG